MGLRSSALLGLALAVLSSAACLPISTAAAVPTVATTQVVFHTPIPTAAAVPTTVATQVVVHTPVPTPSASTSASSSSVVAGTVGTLSGKSLRILPLGDSITWGFGSSTKNGYRQDLLTLLAAANATTDLVGSVRSGTMTDNYNEGHPSWVISQIAGAAAKVTALEPNVVLIHAGTNDCYAPFMPDTAYERIAALITQLVTQWPKAAIIVAQILPATKEPAIGRNNAFNAKLPGVVAAAAASGQHVSLVDMTAAGWTTVDYHDEIHPNNNGYQLMAQVWFAGLQAVAAKGWLV